MTTRAPRRLTLRRYPDWEARLAAAIEAARATPFAWGTFDCWLAAADQVAASTGVDPADWCRGRYRSARGALGVLRRHGGGRLDAMLTTIFGEPVARPFARRGDLALVPLPDDVADAGFDRACATVALDGVAVHAAAPGHGLIRLPLRLADRAWRVG